MSFLKKGPEIKLSEIKVPNFVLDVYYDLKERHLLPLAAILLVAIVAVPIALSQSSSSESPSEVESPLATSSGGTAQAGQLVAKSLPGLRRYQRRLEHLQATDPFKQKFTEENAAPEGTSAEASPEGGGAEGGGGSEPVATAPAPTETEPSSEGEGGSESTGHLKYYSYAIDARVSSVSSPASSSSTDSASTPKKAPSEAPKRRWTTRHNLPELTMLPSRKLPAVIYMGSTKDAKKALMLVSSDVTAIFGEAKCVLGSQTCELLAMEPGLPVTFVYGPAGKTFKVELLKIHLVETKKLNRAPLGKPKKNSSGTAG